MNELKKYVLFEVARSTASSTRMIVKKEEKSSKKW
jgi:hypothetical protein